MRNDCSIVRDLLPLYMENMVSEDTAAFIKEHLADCSTCSKALGDMNTPIIPVAKTDAAPLKNIKKQLHKNKVRTIVLTVMVVFALATSIFSYLTSPSYYPYTPELLSVAENPDGTVAVIFDESVTGYSLQETQAPDGDYTVYTLEAWTTTWDVLFQKRGTPSAIIAAKDEKPFVLYYAQNHSEGGNTAEDIFLYGNITPHFNGVITLPGLSLGYCLLLAALAFLVLGGAWLVFRKKRNARRKIEKLLLLPVSYAIGHLCVLGFTTLSYSEQRDFSLIVVIATMIYCAFLLLLNIYVTRKEIRQINGHQ